VSGQQYLKKKRKIIWRSKIARTLDIFESTSKPIVKITCNRQYKRVQWDCARVQTKKKGHEYYDTQYSDVRKMCNTK